MIAGQKINLIDFIQFMIIENFYIFIFQQVKIHLMPIVANTHDKGALRVEGIDFFMKRKLYKFFFTHG